MRKEGKWPTSNGFRVHRPIWSLCTTTLPLTVCTYPPDAVDCLDSDNASPLNSLPANFFTHFELQPLAHLNHSLIR